MAKKGLAFVKHVKTTETEAMKGLWRTGVATRSQLEEHFGIKADRLKKLENSKYIKTHHEKVYLNEKGISHLEKMGLRYRYVSPFQNFSHDIRLTEIYLRTPEQYRDTWKTEKQLHAEARQHQHKYEQFEKRMRDGHSQGKFQAATDAAVYSPAHGAEVCIDVVTSNYKEEDIDQKIEFAHEFGYADCLIL